MWGVGALRYDDEWPYTVLRRDIGFKTLRGQGVLIRRHSPSFDSPGWARVGGAERGAFESQWGECISRLGGPRSRKRAMLLNSDCQCCCVFCGCPINSHKSDPNGHKSRMYCRSDTPLRSVRSFLETRCVKTGFHYAAVMQLSGGDDESNALVSVCSACRGWRRRIVRRCRSVRGRLGRYLTPFDSVVKGVLAPGTVLSLDQRNWHLVAEGLIHQGNLFKDVLPLPVRSILTKMLESTDKADHRALMARTWYDYNSRPEFFSSGKLAHMIKRFM